MTQEEKYLLLRDLCPRLPYGVKVQCESDGGMLVSVYDMTLSTELLDGFVDGTENIRPYLRPMSTMTEEEREEYDIVGLLTNKPNIEEFDWLNAHHFDYRGLIDKGLAIELTSK